MLSHRDTHTHRTFPGAEPLTPDPDPAPTPVPVRDAEFAACLNPADITFAVVSGLFAIARCMADAAAPCTPCIGFSLLLLLEVDEANISGRAEKYLFGRERKVNEHKGEYVFKGVLDTDDTREYSLVEELEECVLFLWLEV